MIIGFKKKTSLSLVSQERLVNNEWYLFFSLIKGASTINLEDWTANNHRGAEWLLNFIEINEPEHIQKDINNIGLPVQTLMKEMEGQEGYLQKILDFPPLFDGGLQLESKGLIHNNDYRLTYKWINSDSRPLLQSERRGSFLFIGEKRFLLPVHAWKMAESLDAIRSEMATNEGVYSRLKTLSVFDTLKSLLPEEEQSKFSASSDISSIKLHYANAFRIEATPEPDGYKIRPVLLKRNNETEGAGSTFESVLTPNEQNKYAEKFANSTNLLPYYNLGVGKYLVLGEQLNKVLKIVHKVQHTSPDERLNFLKNPKAAFAESLEGIMDEEELNSIFSDRVIGIGDWNAKVIPWIKIPPSNWIPDGNLPDVLKGIDIAGIKIELSTKQAEDLLARVDEAYKQGIPFIDYDGVSIPVTENARAAIATIIPKKPETHEGTTQEADTLANDNKQQTVMLVKENLECIEFEVFRTPRANYPSQNDIVYLLKHSPKPHQNEAFEWLCTHYKIGSRGVLLADDMGLGKTFQSLMFLSWLREGMMHHEIQEKPLLIIAPVGLLNNWEKEIDAHLQNGLGHVVKIYGSNLKDIKSGHILNVNKLRSSNVVLSTYETLEKYQTSFAAVDFAAVIFDEIQKLKNPGIKNYSAACSLKCDFWIGMTGTPVENRLCDLWAITDILEPGLLGSIKEFSNKYEKAMLDGGEIALQRTLELQNGLIHATAKAPAFMMRRMKTDILDGLPAKYPHERGQIMPQEQKSAYNQVLEDVRNSEGKNGSMLEALHKLRAYSLHPNYKHADYEKNFQGKTPEFISQSARLTSCFKILDEIEKKREKALIFIEYNEWHKQDFLCEIIKKRYSLAELPMVINGQVDSKSRQERVDKFQQSRGVFDVMLLSPRAGGVGLTLTAANHVIHLTRWWNPAVEDQATDRVYRIGQELPVHVYYPMSIHPELPKSCFDYNLNQLLTKKRELSTQVLIAPLNNDDAISDLIKDTFKNQKSFEMTLSESYVISGQEYEEIVLSRLQKFAPAQGFQVRRTPKSWDGGADMIIETMDGQTTAIIQCKKVSDSNKTSEMSPDLERAFTNYGCNSKVFQIGITNASKLSKIDENWKNTSKQHLIFYSEDGLKPEALFKDLR